MIPLKTYNKLLKEHKELLNAHLQLGKEAARLRNEVQFLNNKILKMEGVDVPQSVIQQGLIKAFEEACFKNHGQRYIELTKEVCAYIYLQNRACYLILARNSNLPSESTVKSYISIILKKLKADNIMFGKLYESNRNLLIQQRKLLNIKENEIVDVGLAIDAVAVKASLSNNKEELKGLTLIDEDTGEVHPITYLYCFQIDYVQNSINGFKAHSFELFYLYASQGVYYNRVADVIKDITKDLKENGFHLTHISSDGDGWYRTNYTNTVYSHVQDYISIFFNTDRKRQTQSNLVNLLHAYLDGKILPDCVHQGKRMRSRLLSYSIAISGFLHQQEVNFGNLYKDLLEIQGDPVNPNEGLSQQDELPLVLFKFTNLKKLYDMFWSHGNTHEIIDIIILFCTNYIFTNTQLLFSGTEESCLPKFELSLLKYCSLYKERFFDDNMRMDNATFAQQTARVKERAYTPVQLFTKEQFVDYTVMTAQYFRLLSLYKNINFLSLTTYRVELHFAELRNMLTYKFDLKTVECKIIHHMGMQEIANKIGIVTYSSRQPSTRTLVVDHCQPMIDTEVQDSIKVGNLLFNILHVIPFKYDASLDNRREQMIPKFQELLTILYRWGIFNFTVQKGNLKSSHNMDSVILQQDYLNNRFKRFEIAGIEGKKDLSEYFSYVNQVHQE